MSDIRTYEILWLRQPALVLETPALRFITIPGMGAKIVSLFDKRANREWLLPPIHRSFEPVAYGAPFIEQDMSGWDEMFPTINACQYPVDGRYKDAALPDHGEVWALPWQVNSITNDSITLSTAGRALPYRLARTTQVLSERRLRLALEVVNISPEPLVALWAAHPQFTVNRQTQIKLPEAVEYVVNVYSPPEWGILSQTHPWPKAQTKNGQLLSLDHIGAPNLRICRKSYILPDKPVSWAALQQGEAGDWIRLSWDSDRVPYLGVWVDEGAYNPASTAALEPATGYYDSLDVAWQNNRVMHLPPNEPVRWHIDIEIGSGMMDTSKP
jgi:galactose mutarotase-like enzyme